MMTGPLVDLFLPKDVRKATLATTALSVEDLADGRRVESGTARIAR